MAGYVIHIATGNAILKKNKSLALDYNSFLSGLIAPDYKKNALIEQGIKRELTWQLTHKMDMDKDFDSLTDFEKGYFIHLITDIYFYKKYNTNKPLYEDYNKTNRQIMKIYNVVLPNEIKNEVKFVNEAPQILDIKGLVDFIEFMSNLDIKNEYNKFKSSEMNTNHKEQ